MKRIKYDKRMHFGVGAALGVAGAIIGSFLWWLWALPIVWVGVLSTLLPLVAGFLKECHDSKQKNNRFDYKDMLATWAGGFIVLIPVWLILYA